MNSQQREKLTEEAFQGLPAKVALSLGELDQTARNHEKQALPRRVKFG